MAISKTTKDLQSKIYAPPAPEVAIEALEWRKWFNEVVWPLIGKGVGGSGIQGTFPQLQVGKARFTTDNEFQELLNLNQGLYTNYYSSVNGIIYGFACNVHRSKGDAFTVGAQINSWAERGVTGALWGIATECLAQPGSNSVQVAIEPSVVCMNDSTLKPKYGMNPVFKNRLDGATVAGNGLGSNFYNYYSRGLVFSSQGRSTSTEYCGWNVGIEFGDGWGDQELVPAWSAVITYLGGQCVSSGGVVWKAITTSLNQVPAAGSAYWVQRTGAGVNNLAVGIDFSSMGVASMARMASAIRLRATQMMHWEESGTIGSYYDAAAAVMHVVQNGIALRLGCSANGDPWLGSGLVALGGGAAPVFGTIGGVGPAVAAQNSWLKVIDATTGIAFWVPTWK